MIRLSNNATFHAALLAVFAIGCGDSAGIGGDPDSSTDSDTDVDTDIDADTDADTDTGTDTDTETDPTPIWPPYDAVPSWTSLDPGYATGAAFADIDGDGEHDLVVANGNDMLPGPLMVYLADGEGSLPTSASWTSDSVAYHAKLAAGDVNGDGLVDVVAAVYLGEDGFDTPGGVVYYQNDGGALPAVPTWQSSSAFYCFGVALGDIDGDGDLDLAAATGDAYYHEPEADRLFLNEGGAFVEPAAWTSAVPRHSLDVAFLDANDDGWSDLVFASIGAPHAIYLNEGEGLGLPSAEPSLDLPGGAFEGNTVAVGDIDGDSAVDVVVSDNLQLGGPGTVRAFCGPAFDLRWTSADEPVNQSAVALHDLDGDGDLDLVVGSWWGPIRFYRNNLSDGDDAPFEDTPSAVTDTETVVETIVFHDVNGDGKDDLLATDWTPDHGNDLFFHR